MNDILRRERASSNRFLIATQAALRSSGREQLRGCDLEPGDILIEAYEPVLEVFFPLTCVVSQIALMDQEKHIEVDSVGNEGFVGLPAALDREQALRCVVQVPGQAVRMDATLFRRILAESSDLDRLTRHYTLAKLHQLAQSVACNALHSVRQRMCRWLLKCHDCVGVDEFPLTQKYLSQMLGVRRPTISEAAARLQLEGLITYKRGRLTIRDRHALEQRACVCYGIVKQQYDRLLN